MLIILDLGFFSFQGFRAPGMSGLPPGFMVTFGQYGFEGYVYPKYINGTAFRLRHRVGCRKFKTCEMTIGEKPTTDEV